MLDPTASLLMPTAVATAVIHTLIPDHWLPFVLVGRSRRWTVRRTAIVSGTSAAIHAALSVALAIATVRIGQEAARVLGQQLERASGTLLVAFGAVYALWAWRKGGHFHPGGATLHGSDEPAPACDGHEGFAEETHLHYHADDAWIRPGGSRGAWALAFIVGANPCVLLLPIVAAAAGRGPAEVGLVIGAYTIVTVGLMVGLSVVGVMGTMRIPVPAIARHMEAASGILIAAVGGLFLLFGH